MPDHIARNNANMKREWFFSQPFFIKYSPKAAAMCLLIVPSKERENGVERLYKQVWVNLVSSPLTSMKCWANDLISLGSAPSYVNEANNTSQDYNQG